MSHDPHSEPVSDALRAVEQEIDRHYLVNPLVAVPYGQAAWYFLAHCEELLVREIVQTESGGRRPTAHDRAALRDTIVVHAKWPLRWLIASCPRGDGVLGRYDENMYAAASDLSDLAIRYLPFESAFTHASLGLVALTLDGHTVRASNTFRGDPRYEAYDRLTDLEAPVKADVQVIAFLEQVANSVGVDGEQFQYALNPRVIQLGLTAFGAYLDSRFRLPQDWQLPRYRFGDLVQVARVLYLMATIHFHARLTAARLGCVGLGYARALILMAHGELIRRLRRCTGIREHALSAIIEDLTFGARGLRNPDPALQPLIPLSASKYAIAPSLVMSNSFERNVSVLLNRFPDERGSYSRLSGQRAILLRESIVDKLGSLGLRFWHGSLPDWQDASDIDLAIVSDAERRCLILELKSFLAPAEPRELRDRSEEIARGIKQIQARMGAAARMPEPLRTALQIDRGYRLTWAVASETSIGSAHVQTPGVPVVRTGHLIRRCSSERSLAALCNWLQDGAYLPVEGTHYQVIDQKTTIGKWTVEWYGIKCLVDDYISL